MAPEKLGIAIVGIGGAVGTTMVAGIELIKRQAVDLTGLPLAGIADTGLANYADITFGGWDLFGDDLSIAAEQHDVLTHKQFVAAEGALNAIKPWPAVADSAFLANIDSNNVIGRGSLWSKIEAIRADLSRFRNENGAVVVINLASTERVASEEIDAFTSLDRFEEALNADSAEISPAMLYAYAAIAERVPYGNFTPSAAADIPALVEFAQKQNVPVAGKDGKTGQTFIKTVLAPALRSRALHVDGWYSANLLGNRDGLALSNEDSLASKVKTKGSVLDDILGYPVEDHLIDIRYYRPRGDNKEAWDSIDVTGFLGQQMQIKVNFLCRDSILAAPLAIEIARCLDLAAVRGESGIQEQLSVFFKLPMSKTGGPQQAFHLQEKLLLDWLLASPQPTLRGGSV